MKVKRESPSFQFWIKYSIKLDNQLSQLTVVSHLKCFAMPWKSILVGCFEFFMPLLFFRSYHQAYKCYFSVDVQAQSAYKSECSRKKEKEKQHQRQQQQSSLDFVYIFSLYSKNQLNIQLYARYCACLIV